MGWSPDNKALVAYGTGLDRVPKIGFISLINLDFREIIGLSAYSFFVFSPDYSKIIVAKNAGTNPKDLLVILFSKTDLEITEEPILVYKDYVGYAWGFSWSPGGDKIAVCTDGEIWICNTDGGNAVKLTHTPEKEMMALWSPDGKLIATRLEDSQFRLIRVSDGEVLMTHDSVDSWSWSPDGKGIVLACYNYQLISISIPNGNIRVITNWQKLCNSTYLDGIYWSPDGKWIAVNGPADEVDLISKIYLVNPIDGKVTELAAADPASKVSMYWSPDSKWIAYSTEGHSKARLESTFWEADLTEFMNKVEPGTAIGLSTDFDFNVTALPPGGVAPDGIFTDTRDGHEYKYKKIGNQTWMAENLAWLPKVSSSTDYSLVDKHFYVHGYEGTSLEEALSTENYTKYGVLYNWPSVLDNPCPAGWHVPDDQEWKQMEKSLGMNEEDIEKEGWRSSGSVNKKIMSPIAWDDDDIFIGQSGFNALPGGLFSQRNKFEGIISTMAYFWVLTDQQDWYGVRYIGKSNSGIHRFFGSVSAAALSVRCVRDQ